MEEQFAKSLNTLKLSDLKTLCREFGLSLSTSLKKPQVLQKLVAELLTPEGRIKASQLSLLPRDVFPAGPQPNAAEECVCHVVGGLDLRQCPQCLRFQHATCMFRLGTRHYVCPA